MKRVILIIQIVIYFLIKHLAYDQSNEYGNDFSNNSLNMSDSRGYNNNSNSKHR